MAECERQFQEAAAATDSGANDDDDDDDDDDAGLMDQDLDSTLVLNLSLPSGRR